MQITPTPQPAQDLSISANGRLPISLRLGEVVEAEVVSVTETAVAIRMKNTILEAQTNVLFKEGDKVRLRVDGWENAIRLRLVPGGTAQGADIRSFVLDALNSLQSTRPAADDLVVMSAFLRSIPSASRAAVPELTDLLQLLLPMEELTAAALEKQVAGSGIFLETKLRLQMLQQGEGDAAPAAAPQVAELRQDMKAALLAVRDALKDPEILERLARTGIRPDAVASAADNLLRSIEVLQLRSKLNDTLQVFLPFVWQDLREGELIFRESDPGREGMRAYACTVNLDLERTGKVSTRALLQAGIVHVLITGEQEQFLGLLESGAELLRNQFSASGITLGTLSIRHVRGMDFAGAPAGRLDVNI